MGDPKETKLVIERTEVAQEDFEASMEAYFDGDLEAVCDLENPESCESCQ